MLLFRKKKIPIKTGLECFSDLVKNMKYQDMKELGLGLVKIASESFKEAKSSTVPLVTAEEWGRVLHDWAERYKK